MEFALARPDGLDSAAWEAIEDGRSRLEEATAADDRPLAIGTAKDLAEAVARVVLGARGETVASNEDFSLTVSRAHDALKRQPGTDLAADPEIRAIAQSLKTIVTQLPALRNRCGTGHGRAVLPDISAELMVVAVDGAMLWVRWALRRLEALIAGSTEAIVRDLLDAEIFRKGELAMRIAAADLKSLDKPELRSLGIAVAHRSMNGTFVVQEDGVEACARSSSLEAWPSAYRAGVAEGLLLNRNGYVSADVWGATHVAMVLAPAPDASAILDALSEGGRDLPNGITRSPSIRSSGPRSYRR